MRICWIASYPRSGNTWMRLLLHDVLYGELGSTPDLQRRIPDVHREMNGFSPDRPVSLLKTHYLWGAEHPLAGKSAGFVYVVRDPRDVLFSAMNYVALSGESAESRPAFARDFIRSGGLLTWIRGGFGSWAEHTASWIRRTRMPRVVVRYEDLRSDTAGQLRRVLGFLGEDASDADIGRAVERNRLEALQGREDREKRSGSCWFPGTAEQARQGVRFFNAGRTGQRLDDLSPGLDAAFDAEFARDMAPFGYGPEADADSGFWAARAAG